MLLITYRHHRTEIRYILYVDVYVSVLVYLNLLYVINFVDFFFFFILKVLLSFCLILCIFQPVVAYKRVAYIKIVYYCKK